MAVSATNTLSDEVFADLDVVQGGIGWWNDQIGWKRSALLGEYLQACCSGIVSSLQRSELALKEFETLFTTQNFNLHREWVESARAGKPEEDRVRIATKHTEKYQPKMGVWTDVALSSMAQALDRLAAIVAIVGGFKEDVLRTDWGKIDTVAKKALSASPLPAGGKPTLAQRLAEPGTAGRARQNDLLRTVMEWPDHGPEDWLPWLQKSRNTAVHRAARMEFFVMLAGKAQPEGLTLPFWAQPDWADTEAMVRSSRQRFDNLFLLPLRQDILAGLLQSTSKLGTTVLNEATSLWVDRRADPGLIVQHGGQWPEVETSEPLNFPGYGPKARLVFKDIRMNPKGGHRLRAARLTDDQLHHWAE